MPGWETDRKIEPYIKRERVKEKRPLNCHGYQVGADTVQLEGTVAEGYSKES